MLLHTDHLVPGMRLEKDIELKAGSFLITRRELGDSRLTKKVIESIQAFSGQLAPEVHKVNITDDKFALGYVKQILDQDLRRIADNITSGNYPNFLADSELQEKVMHVLEILFSNPDIILIVYDAKFNSPVKNKPLDQLIDHSIRATLLAVALGMKLKRTIVSLVSIGMAGLIHDLGILCMPIFPNLKELDEMPSKKIHAFVEEHQLNGARLLQESELSMSPYQKGEIIRIVANHHYPDPGDKTHQGALVLYFADLVDEMISTLPHSMRYNFTAEQLKILGEKYSRQNGLVNTLLGLARLYKSQSGPAWEMVAALAGLFQMGQLLAGEYEEKLEEIVKFCPFGCARVNPPLDGNTLPRTIYCGRSCEKDFSCEHLVYIKVEIQSAGSGMREYLKCGTLGARLQKLIDQDTD